MIAAEMMPNTQIDMNARVVSDRGKGEASCYGLTVFTQKWGEVRDFYAFALGAKVVSERTNRYCDMLLGGLPVTLRPCDYGESVSYFHIYLALEERGHVLGELRNRGVIVTFEGPYANFRDPEGRVFKLSETEAIVG